MTRVTRFAGRDPGFGARMSGFMAHLRANGMNLGVSETDAALNALTHIHSVDPQETRLALKAVCAGSQEDAGRFDELFDAYWMDAGRVREKVVPTFRSKQKHTRNSAEPTGESSGASGSIHSPDQSGDGDSSASEGNGKLVASRVQNMMKKDLRELVSSQDIRAAQKIAEDLGRSLRDKRSRRRRAASKGDRIDFRKVVRKSLATGGEPLTLPRRNRPDRPRKIVALCDVSGSMVVYARVFLAFLSGLMRADNASDAYLFHTRLVRISDALRDEDPLRSLNRVTLLADGFGGGSKIGANLEQFTRNYARKFVDGRSVVFIFSDGYDTDPPEKMAEALRRLRKRGCRIVWLNPLKGWAGYEPVARGMAGALPYLDMFRAANTMNDLAALEKEVTAL